jgi:hypothetical protein
MSRARTDRLYLTGISILVSKLGSMLHPFTALKTRFSVRDSIGRGKEWKSNQEAAVAEARRRSARVNENDRQGSDAAGVDYWVERKPQ